MSLGLRSASLLAAIASALCWPQAVRAEEKFVAFEDPLEHAFGLDVPRGWSAHGGMFRVGYSDFRPMLDLKSRDGKVEIRSGDVAIPRAYALPTSVHSGEGDVDDLGAQAQLVYARYRTGREYAGLYALARFKKYCHSLTPQVSDWTPPSSGNAQASSAGSVTYRCGAHAGGTRIAYVYAAMLQAPDAHGLWGVASLVSFIAPPQRVESARAVVVRGTRTFRLHPAWVARQKKLEELGLRYQAARQQARRAALTRQVAEFAARMRGMQAQVDSFERGQAARRSEFQGFDNALNGVTPTVDPLDGRMRDVWTGPHNGYWENGAGTIVNADGSPGAGFHELQPR